MASLIERPIRAAILAAAGSETVHRAVKRYGMALGARRFVAGETAEEFLAAAKAVNAQGFAVACGILGENITEAQDAREAADQYCALLRTFADQKIDANVAFKLTHVGLDIDPNLAYENAARIAQTALDTGNTMRLDMEQSIYVDRTLDIYRRLRDRYANVGFVLQSYLHRSLSDLASTLPLEPSVRFVKGAYLEPASIAYEDKHAVDEAYVHLIEKSLTNPGYTAIATHDPTIIAKAEEIVAREKLPLRGRFEFQMLYGISTPLAKQLVDKGYRVRLAIPFGSHWFPYLMRRLAERPANLAFFLKGALSRQ
jgi:proline dehydrogenase